MENPENNGGTPEQWGHGGAAEFSGVTIDELESLCHTAFKYREQIMSMERDVEEWKAKLREVQERVVSHLSSHGKISYKSNAGTLSIAKKLSVKVPQNPDDKKTFFDYLKAKGIFEDMVNVHSARLNSFYRAEWDLARNDGVSQFSMPGIGEPAYYEYLQMRK